MVLPLHVLPVAYRSDSVSYFFSAAPFFLSGSRFEFYSPALEVVYSCHIGERELSAPLFFCFFPLIPLSFLRNTAACSPGSLAPPNCPVPTRSGPFHLLGSPYQPSVIPFVHTRVACLA